MDKQKKSKPPLAILAPHPAHGGGVLSSLKVVYSFAERYFTPQVFCLSFLPPVAMSWRNLRLSSSIRQTVIEGMSIVEIGARFSRFEPGLYWFTKDLWQQVLDPYRYVFVTGGTPHLAHPAVILRKKFILWLASTYLDDRRHRLQTASFAERVMGKLNRPLMDSVERQILERASVLLPISSYTKKLCTDVLGFERSNMRVCPVPVANIHPIDRSMQDGLLHVIAVGRFTDPRKNFKMLLAVCEELLVSDKRFCVDIVGVYPSDNYHVLRLASAFPERITFHGFVEQKKLEELYANAFASVITSEQEGLGIVGIDALSWGIPVVATRCGGVLDYVKPGVSGFLVEPYASSEMVAALKLLANNPQQWNILSAGALKLVQACFSKESVEMRFAWALMQAYPELVDVFVAQEQQEIGDETFSRGTRLSSAY